MGAYRTIMKVERKSVVCMLIRHTCNITSLKTHVNGLGWFESKHMRAVKHVITYTVLRSVMLL